MGMLFKLISKCPHLSLKMRFGLLYTPIKKLMMAEILLNFNNLNLNAMSKKTAFRHGQNYHEEGIGTVTVLLAIATVIIIFYSIYSAL